MSWKPSTYLILWKLGVPRLHVNKEQLNLPWSLCYLSALPAPAGLRDTLGWGWGADILHTAIVRRARGLI